MFSTIDSFYRTALGRVPSFEEVEEHFVAIVGGACLSDRLQFIADGKEAESFRANLNGPVDTRSSFTTFIEVVYLRCLKRAISEGEIGFWYEKYLSGISHREILMNIDRSLEALSIRSSSTSNEWDDGTFIQLLHELIAGRGANPSEIDHYQRALAKGITRDDLLRSFFERFSQEATKKSLDTPLNAPKLTYLPGRSKFISIEDWRERDQCDSAPSTTAEKKPATRFEFRSTKSPLVSVITSLFKGGRYIEAFLKNITSQSIFREHCELLIIDANSPEGELEKAKPFLDRFDNIHYKKLETQIGIYEAWNWGIKEARGDYITNANLDDCRRHDSLEIQASTLNALPFVDVVYQDVLYSFSENLDFETIARHNISTEFPIVSRYNLLEFNSPHNGPMWRKALHDELGFFDASFLSAGDLDFWMRCVLNNKTFYKLNDPHVAYYVNPFGLSTRADTPGVAESNRITKALNRSLISPYITMDKSRFAEKLSELGAKYGECDNKYAMVQSALRNLSARSRTQSAR